MATTECQLIYDYFRIPSGSRVEMWVEGGATDFVCTARVKTRTSLQVFDDAALHRAPGGGTMATFPLAHAETYVVTVFVNFRRDATATLAFQIVKPDGSSGPAMHGTTPLRCTITGQAGDEADPRTFFLQTLKS
jgi:hypothetical protein